MNNARTELLNLVLVHRTDLREYVQGMDTIILIRNCHPYFRAYITDKLVKEGYMTPSEGAEFSYSTPRPR